MNFRKQHSIEPTPMQLAPLVDVLFLLVIFFAVTFQYAKEEQAMDVSVPAAEAGKEKESRTVGEIIINIKKEGEIVVNGQNYNVDELLLKLQNIIQMAGTHEQAVIIRGDEITDYKHVIRVMDACQKAGIYNIAFATRKPDAPGTAAPAPPK
ncbi:MAG: biopolymer transporter ExbD [Verrucomicrobiaceae bacterium]|nr:biopolymer transporter ExbD [Verrucomicrobiaceae bacterium]